MSEEEKRSRLCGEATPCMSGVLLAQCKFTNTHLRAPAPVFVLNTCCVWLTDACLYAELERRSREHPSFIHLFIHLSKD